VVAALPGGPADLADVKAGDHVQLVDGEFTTGLKVAELAAKLRGPVASDVEVVFRRPGKSQPLKKSIVRARLKVDAKKQFAAVQSAAEAGVAESEAELARLYAAGQGTAQDFVQAYKWYSLAINKGFQRARKDRDALSPHMTADQISRAESLLPASARESEEEKSDANLQKALEQLDKPNP
jgi:TPR repeat protein